ncbi:MAG: hypothetical protein ACM4AI_06685 [Acidobacteriota bacterium]
MTATLLAQSGQPAQNAPMAVSGKWNMTFVSPPGARSILDVKLEAKVLTGTLGGQPIQGEFVDGRIVFAVPDSWRVWRDQSIGNDDAKDMYTLVHFASLNDADTLAGWTDVFIRGYGPQAIKRMSWTAQRVKTE